MRHLRSALRPIVIGLALASAAPVFAAETPREQANKQVVLDFYAALNQADATGTMKERIAGIADRYLSPDYLQHAAMFANLPGPGTARDKLVRMFQNLPPMPNPPAAPTTVAIMAEGDLVMMLTSRPGPGGAGDTYIFNMFRVKDGKLVEHWDVSPAMGPPAGGPPGGMPPMPGAPGMPPPPGTSPAGPPPSGAQ